MSLVCTTVITGVHPAGWVCRPLHPGWRSSMAEQRFCKPDRDERPLVILNGYKGFLFVA
jgi:hypothetical protein